MKKSFLKNSIIAVFAIVIFGGISSCKKKTEDNTPPGEVKKGTLKFHLHSYIGETEVDVYNVAYTNDAGRKISLSLGQFYLDGMYLIKEDGSRYDIPGAMVLKTLDQQTYTVAEVPVGTYKTFGFNVGLADSTNQKVPDSIAILNHPEMWFGTTAQPEGYIYFNAQGKIDTTADASALESEMQTFTYKIGTSAHLAPVVMPDRTFSISEGGFHYLHLYADFNVLFSGVDLSNPANLHVDTKAANSSWIANTISHNVSSMFIYE